MTETTIIKIECNINLPLPDLISGHPLGFRNVKSIAFMSLKMNQLDLVLFPWSACVWHAATSKEIRTEQLTLYDQV